MLGARFIKRRGADAMRAAQLGHRHTDCSLPQDRDDLRLGYLPVFIHNLLMPLAQKILLLQILAFRRGLSLRPPSLIFPSDPCSGSVAKRERVGVCDVALNICLVLAGLKVCLRCALDHRDLGLAGDAALVEKVNLFIDFINDSHPLMCSGTRLAQTTNASWFMGA